jgi:hypothetical protein
LCPVCDNYGPYNWKKQNKWDCPICEAGFHRDFSQTGQSHLLKPRKTNRSNKMDTLGSIESNQFSPKRNWST